jgi:hypothetical protein
VAAFLPLRVVLGEFRGPFMGSFDVD